MTPRFHSSALRAPRPSLGLPMGLALLLVAGCATGNYDGSHLDGSGRSLATGQDSDGGGTSSGLLAREGDGSAGSAAQASMENARRTSMAFPTGDKRTSAVMLEKEMPEEVILGTPFAYRINVENLTDQALESVMITDTIPGSLTVKSVEPVGQVAGGIAKWELGVIPARATKTIVVNGVATGSGSLQTCATVEYKSSLCASTNVVSPALQVALTAPEVGLACDTFDFSVKVTNAGTGDARDVRVIDELPEGLTTITGQSRIEMEFGTLAGAQSKEKAIKLKASGPGTFTHNARAEARGGLVTEAAPISTVLRQPALSLSMKAAERIVAGRPVPTTLTVANTGNGISKDTEVRVNLPKGSGAVDVSEGGKASSSSVVWSLGTLEPGETRELSLGVTSEESGQIVSEAKATAYCAEEVTATARTDVRGLPALLLEVVDESDLILVGEPVTYEIVIENQGSAPDTNIKITCQVEDGIEVIQAGGGAQATFANGTVTFAEIPSLAPGEIVKMQVVVKSSKQADSRFMVSLTSTQKVRPVTETEATNFYE